MAGWEGGRHPPERQPQPAVSAQALTMQLRDFSEINAPLLPWTWTDWTHLHGEDSWDQQPFGMQALTQLQLTCHVSQVVKTKEPSSGTLMSS